MNYLGRTIFSLVYLLLSLSIFSCKKDYICPAYQSYFILDSTKRVQYFSLFAEDSLPKELVEVKKNKYGIIEKMSYQKKNNSLQTLPMTLIYPEISDSALLKIDSLEIMAGDTVTFAR